MDPESDSPIRLNVTGIPTIIGIIQLGVIIGLTFALCLALIYKNPKDYEYQALKSQSEATKASNEAGIAQQKRIMFLQELVAKSCQEKGNIPVFINGNVDCKSVK